MGLPQNVAGQRYPDTPGLIKWVRNSGRDSRYGISFNKDLEWIFSLNKATLPALQLERDGSLAEFVLNSIKDPVFSVDRNLLINSFNRAAEKFTGQQRQQVLGRKCKDVFRSAGCEQCILEKSIKQGRPIDNYTIYISNIRGREIAVTVNASPLLSHDSKIAGGVLVFHNVSSVAEPVVQIQTLGGFYLTMHNKPLYDRMWKGRRLKDLLKAIIALGGTKVPLEKLAFLLWPDSDGDHALNNLKMALSRLRRVGGDDSFVPANWLAVKHKRVSLVRSLCRVDALEFSRSMERPGNLGNAKSLQKVLALYKNDFLPDDDFPWINNFRNHLRTLFIEGVLRLATLKNINDEVLLFFLEQARQADPLHEDIYACLMKHYINSGFPAYALKIFYKAEKVIFLQTGIYPGAVLQSLAVQARNSKTNH
jgi:PAS domain S-box-containing protein